MLSKPTEPGMAPHLIEPHMNQASEPHDLRQPLLNQFTPQAGANSMRSAYCYVYFIEPFPWQDSETWRYSTGLPNPVFHFGHDMIQRNLNEPPLMPVASLPQLTGPLPEWLIPTQRPDQMYNQPASAPNQREGKGFATPGAHSQNLGDQLPASASKSRSPLSQKTASPQRVFKPHLPPSTTVHPTSTDLWSTTPSHIATHSALHTRPAINFDSAVEPKKLTKRKRQQCHDSTIDSDRQVSAKRAS